ncbi:mycothiol conjugate amidase Mca [Leifsonia sp. NPDC080035]|uniref:Mycothiol S-conjugate amidase n=1 Tax=Leifsonia sp. NPDC080035 TaxID=3143936 RepID=A0AAU7GJC3_9MICO
MAVHAHPDDESSKGAGTAARYVADGDEVLIVSCTGGERGDVLNPGLDADALARAARDMAGLRRREMAAAQAVLGVQHRWLGYVDSGMAREDGTLPPDSFAALPLEFPLAPLVRLVRAFRPHVLVTYDENGGYPHPDHIRAHQVGVAAYRAAADPALFPDAGEPWQVSKLYYDRMFSGERLRAVHDALLAADPSSPMLERLREMRSWTDDAPSPATTRVDVGGYLETRDAALRSHASQVAPDDTFFFWPNDVLRAAWPTEDFQLIDSKVETQMPETDLFAGIEGRD